MHINRNGVKIGTQQAEFQVGTFQNDFNLHFSSFLKICLGLILASAKRQY